MKDNVFVFGKFTSNEYFTDRKNETKRLLLNFTYGVNTILISPRRIGKTSLVQKVCKLANSDKLRVVYLDIFSCRSEAEFYNIYASAVLKQISTKLEEFIENAKTFITNITPKFSIGSDPLTDFSLTLEWNDKLDDVNEILQLPEKIAKKKGIKIVVCIDEFQQIADFPHSLTFQKRLRTVWQLQESVSYCLFGSKQHLMNELFEKRSYPFYKFGDVIYLDKIPTPDWVEYIQQRFCVTNKKITPVLAEKIVTTVSNHSSYVQQLAWLTWIHVDEVATNDDFDAAFNDLLNQNSLLFEKQIEQLSAYQMNFLRAMLDGV